MDLRNEMIPTWHDVIGVEDIYVINYELTKEELENKEHIHVTYVSTFNSMPS